MITLTIGKMNKKPNSTKRVFTSSTEITNVTLKENVDMKAPIFKLNFDTSDYNYVVWGDRYYYIDNTVYISNNLWEIHCSLDILATYRDVLLSQPCIEAYDSHQPHVEIDDLRFTPQFIQNQCRAYNQIIDPIKYNLALNTYSIFDVNSGVWGSGSFIVNCISNGDAQGNGAGPHNWVLSASEYGTFMQTLYSFWTGGPFSSTSARVDAINSIIWIPFKCSVLQAHCSTAALQVAGTVILQSAHYFTSAEFIWSDTKTLPIPRIDTDTNVPRFMYNSRWSKYQLMTPSGVVDVDADLLFNSSTISIHVDVDGIDGTVVYKVFPTPSTPSATDLTATFANHILYEGSINYAIDLSWTLQRIRNMKDDVINFTKTVAKVGATVAAAYMGGPLVGAAAGKVVAAQANVDKFQGLNLTQNGIAPLMDAKANLATAQANLAATEQNARLGQAGAYAANIVDQKLHVPGDISENYTKSNSTASVYGANSSIITLSLKCYIDPALVNTPNGTTAKTKYSSFCQLYGYPQPGTLTTLPSGFYPNARLIIVKAIQLATSSSLGNMDADEVIALETMLKHGVWFEQ